MSEIVLPRLYERDIDVLLQEELVFNDKVCEVISQALRLVGKLSVHQCRLSDLTKQAKPTCWLTLRSVANMGFC